jgi:hypothetical protein
LVISEIAFRGSFLRVKQINTASLRIGETIRRIVGGVHSLVRRECLIFQVIDAA